MRVLLLLLLSMQSYGVVIRYNQIGYQKGDSKVAQLCALDGEQLEGTTFTVQQGRTTVFEGTVGETVKVSGTAFSAICPMNFTDFKTAGTYTLHWGTESSAPFVIGGRDEYGVITSDLLRFFQSQRCGHDNALLHGACHLNDTLAAVDASGGWHDAGDYIKFMVTTSFVTLNMLTTLEYAQDFMPESELIDIREESGLPDLAEEARIGLEWMLKMSSRHSEGKLYMQVSGKIDHDFWRLPEEDDISGNVGNPRDLHEGWGNNLNGRSIACFAMAARLYEQYDAAFATQCRERALALWALREQYPVAANKIDYYGESSGSDDMLLAAIELYRLTEEEQYRTYAEPRLDQEVGGHINWVHVDFLCQAAAYRAGINPAQCDANMIDGLKLPYARFNQHPFGLSSGMHWGTTAILTADAQMGIMYYYLTGNDFFLPMAERQRDYLLGANNWGVSFIIGTGKNSPRFPHSQLDDLVGDQIGAVVGGPTSKGAYEKETWLLSELEKFIIDPYGAYHGSEVYYDYISDYISNEVAIDYAASSIFIMEHFRNRAYTDKEPVLTEATAVAKRSVQVQRQAQQLTISLPGEAIAECRLYSTRGQQILAISPAAGGQSVSFSPAKEGLATGVYALEVDGVSGQWQQLLAVH